MSWTAPRTVVPGELIDASYMNTYVRDNQEHLLPHTNPQTIPFDAGMFGANDSMTWTVQSGDIQSHWFYRIGDRLLYYLQCVTTSVGGTVSSRLRITVPGITSFAMDNTTHFVAARDNAVTVSAYTAIGTGFSTIDLLKLSGNWTLSTNNTQIIVGVDCQVVS